MAGYIGRNKVSMRVFMAPCADGGLVGGDIRFAARQVCPDKTGVNMPIHAAGHRKLLHLLKGHLMQVEGFFNSGDQRGGEGDERIMSGGAGRMWEQHPEAENKHGT